MPSPINGLTGSNPQRLILRFGQKPLPQVGTLLPWIDLNDGVAWKLKDFKNEADRRIYLGQVHGRGRGFQISDDFYPRLITLTHYFDERSLQNFAAAKAAITQAGEQWLTFDNVTAMSAKAQSMKAPTLMVPAPVTPFWESVSEFIAADPFARDLQPSGSIPNLLNPNGGFEVAGQTQTLWRSLDTLSTGTLNYWTIDVGAPTIAANVITIPTSSAMRGGHPDWGDTTFQFRFNWVTGSIPTGTTHYKDGNNYVYTYVDGANLHITKVVGGVSTAVVAGVAAALASGTWYWLQIVWSGTTITAKVFADNAGAINLASQIGVTATGVVADAGVATGQVRIESAGGATAAYTVGGAFQGTCIVSGTGPAGATPQVIAGEPAFAWSTNAPYSGTRSVSVYNAIAAGAGQWNLSGGGALVTYLATTRVKTVGATGIGATINLQNIPAYNHTVSAPAMTGTQPWSLVSSPALVLSGADTAVQLTLLMQGAGTAYFDEAVLQQAFEATAGLYAQPFFDRINLPGAVNPGTATSFSIPYVGTVWTDQVLYQINLPANSNVNLIKIANNTSGEVLTIIIPAPLTVAGYLQIDSNAFTVTDQAGTQYDMSGSFPMLYPGALNAFTVTVQTSAGVVTATLDIRWTNRWEVQ